MTKCIEKLPHSCGSSDGMQVFMNDDGTYTGFCFACGTYVPSPYEDRPEGFVPPKKRASSLEVKDLLDLPIKELKHRGISEEATKYFGIRSSHNEETGEVSACLFPYEKDGEIKAFKIKFLNKTMFVVGEFKSVEPFGWNQAIHSGRKRLYITEGEEDAAAVVDLIQAASAPKFKDLIPAVISIPTGASGAVKSLVPYLQIMKDTFEETILVFDNDEPGEEARRAVQKVAPWMKHVTLPLKDANACLLSDKKREAGKQLLWKPTALLRPNKRVNGVDLRVAAKTPAPWGLSWPFKQLTEATRGIRRGEVYYLGAGVKMGKSEIVDTVAAHMIIEHNCPVFLIKPEQSLKDSYKRIVGKVAGKIFHDPNIPFDEEAYDKAADLVGDKISLIDNYQFLKWADLRPEIEIACMDGIKDFFIDPITCFTNGLTDSEANTELRTISADIANLMLQHGANAYLFCHLNKPESGPPHERGGAVYSTQFTGSRAMMRSCHLMIGVEGNKDPSLDEHERNIRWINILEAREFGNGARFPVYWDKNTGLFTEIYDKGGRDR